MELVFQLPLMYVAYVYCMYILLRLMLTNIVSVYFTSISYILVKYTCICKCICSYICIFYYILLVYLTLHILLVLNTKSCFICKCNTKCLQCKIFLIFIISKQLQNFYYKSLETVHFKMLCRVSAQFIEVSSLLGKLCYLL